MRVVRQATVACSPSSRASVVDTGSWNSTAFVPAKCSAVRDAYVAGALRYAFPFGSQVARLGVALEVVGQHHGGIARDVFVAGVTRCDSNVC